jgi:hypothetical protein
MHLVDLPDGVLCDPFLGQADTPTRVPLIAYLSDDLVPACGCGQCARLRDRTSQKLLNVDVFAELHRSHGHNGVRMVWRGDDDRIDVDTFLEQRLVVTVPRRRGKRVKKGVQRLPARPRFHRLESDFGHVALIDVAEGDDVGVGSVGAR